VWFDRLGDRERDEWSGSTEHFMVRDGTQRWSWDPHRGPVVDHDDHPSPGWNHDTFLDPSLLLPAVNLQIVGHDTVAGREG
jgi:hypothetical protein